MRNFKGAIFDLDGTVLDSMWVWDEVDKKFLGKRGIAVPDDYLEQIAHIGYTAAAAYTIERFGLDETEENIVAEWSSLAADAYAHDVVLKPYAKDFLIQLKNNGVRLSVATASNALFFEPALKRCGIYDLFDAFTTSDEVARGKGFPDIYLLAAQKIGLTADECIVFEDIYAGIKGAADGGFYTIGVYDKYSLRERDRIVSCADMYIYGYDELIGQC